jgi:hypothetical protein
MPVVAGESLIIHSTSYSENIVKIAGGNHAWFGNYGDQKGDPPATISREKQQQTAVEAIVPFIAAKINR